MSNTRSFRIENKTPLTLVDEGEKTYEINGITLTAPFILTDQQAEALRTIINDFIHSDRANINTFAFKGYAGTGKTSIINMVEQYIQQRGYSIAFTAPTNRAAEVMKANNVSSNVSTIHRLLGLQLHIDIEVFNADLSKLIKRQRDLARYDFVVIDEASMINDNLYLSIKRIFVDTLGARIIFMGDPAQLRPIGSSGISMALTEPKLECELTEVRRTSSNAILTLLTKIRNGEAYGLESSQEYRFVSSEEEFLRHSLESFNHLHDDVLYYRVLCGINEAVAHYNNYFHKALFVNEPDEPEYHIGSLVMSYKNGTEGFHNSMDGFVTEIQDAEFAIGNSKKGNKATYKGYYLTVLVNSLVSQSFEDVKATGNLVKIPVISRDNDWTLLREYLHQLHDDKKQSAYNKLMKDYYFPEDIYNDNGKKAIKKGIDYGYAQTVHKSQGGTYSHTGVVINSFKPFEGQDIHKEMLYVAFSRCKDSFVGLIGGGADILGSTTSDESVNQSDINAEMIPMSLLDDANTANEETRRPDYDVEEIPF